MTLNLSTIPHPIFCESDSMSASHLKRKFHFTYKYNKEKYGTICLCFSLYKASKASKESNNYFSTEITFCELID